MPCYRTSMLAIDHLRERVAGIDHGRTETIDALAQALDGPQTRMVRPRKGYATVDLDSRAAETLAWLIETDPLMDDPLALDDANAEERTIHRHLCSLAGRLPAPKVPR